MKLTRKAFYNKRNGQCSITLPKKTVMLLRNDKDKLPKKISFEILTDSERKELKKL